MEIVILIAVAVFVAIWLFLRWAIKLGNELEGDFSETKMRQRSLVNHRRDTKIGIFESFAKKRMKESRELAKETYKKARSSKDDKEYSHPTEHDESDDLELAHLHQGNKRGL